MFLPRILNHSLSGPGGKWFAVSLCVNTCLWVTAGAGQSVPAFLCEPDAGKGIGLLILGLAPSPHTGTPEQGRELLMGPSPYISSKILQTDLHSLLFLCQLYQLCQIQDRSEFQTDFTVKSCNKGHSATALQSIRASCAKVPVPLSAHGILESEGRAEPPPPLFPWAAPGTQGHTHIVLLGPSVSFCRPASDLGSFSHSFAFYCLCLSIAPTRARRKRKFQPWRIRILE